MLRKAVNHIRFTAFFRYKKHISHYIGPLSSVIELGCGTGYYAMYFSAQCKTYVGVDLTPENIELLNQKAAARGLNNVTGVVGDATTLNGIPSASFDVVLVSRAPLSPAAKRERAGLCRMSPHL
ncbi:class I SAM-dependent methyltransferase [Neobittarella massiliensis]|uniref:class I SAM-dependent methyltransferase n=1 Tax=Neobittarella massiliensis (ex Bilen et al. 2018) TaxID=2041842 RepID=UPI0013EC0CAD